MTSPTPDQASEYLLPQSVAPRGLAYILDTLIVAVLTAVLISLGLLKGQGLESLDPEAIREMLQSNSGLAVYLILFVYFMVFEGAWGRTPGKMALGLRVVRIQDGSPCGWARALIRNAIRPLDLFFVGLPGGMVVMLTPGRQRIGDLLGGTMVVRALRVPDAMATVVPGLLRRCSSCGRLAPAAGPCPACAAPAPPSATTSLRGQPFPQAIMQPIAGMMAVGEAAAAVRTAAQDLLVAEAAYGEAAAAESTRLGGQGPGPTRGDAVPDSSGELDAGAAADGLSTGVGDEAVAAAAPAESEEHAFVHTEDAPGLSEDYVGAWRHLMAAVETLRARRADLDAALVKARVPLGQVVTADPILRGLLDQVEPYGDADDDEAVLQAFMTRTSAATAADGPADDAGDDTVA